MPLGFSQRPYTPHSLSLSLADFRNLWFTYTIKITHWPYNLFYMKQSVIAAKLELAWKLWKLMTIWHITRTDIHFSLNLVNKCEEYHL